MKHSPVKEESEWWLLSVQLCEKQYAIPWLENGKSLANNDGKWLN